MAVKANGISSEPPVVRQSVAPAVSECHFTMYVISIKDVLNFKRLPMHEDLLKKGLLKRVNNAEMSIHFISHVWLSTRHPDPEGVKLRQFQSICHKIMDGQAKSLFDLQDWEAFSTGCSAARTFQALRSELIQEAMPLDPDSFKYDIENGYCWWDFMSVPQQVDSNEEALAAQKRAISSIPHYIEHSSYFWVLVPEAVHAERGGIVGYEVWQSRGWCRLEEWGNFLSLRVAPPLVVTGVQRVGVVDTMDFLALRSGIGGLARHAACQGRFSCCDMGHRLRCSDGRFVDVRCDKEEVKEILKKMLPFKLDHYEKTGKSFMHRFLRDASYSVYAGSGIMEPPTNAAELLLACRADSASAGYEGLTPLTWACTYGSTTIVRELLNMGARADQSVTILQCAAQRGNVDVLQMLLDTGQLGPDALSKGSPKANIGGLDRGAKAGHGEICRCLLAAKASPHTVRKDNGQTPLHTAAEGGHVAVCRALLEARARVDVADLLGRTPLTLSARRLTLFGRSAGKAQCARLLLDARADPEARDAYGRSPADVALEDGHQSFMDILEKRHPMVWLSRWWQVCTSGTSASCGDEDCSEDLEGVAQDVEPEDGGCISPVCKVGVALTFCAKPKGTMRL
mmetsp:Transcript_51848/g.160837  ORF Transcript_51848/g.160837 Transcript_51848/m.160837 type:complete len:625 (+) Transcript_51848:78-1952(+)